MKPLVHSLSQTALNAIFPPRCAACNAWLENEELWCVACEKSLKILSHPLCSQCGIPIESGERCADCRKVPPHFESLRALWMFEHRTQEAIHRLKYEGQTSVAAPLGKQLAALLGKEPFPPQMILVPVPLHPWRKWRRGFNQSELLAREVCKVRSISTVLATNILRRARWTSPQVELHEQEREANVAGAFVADAALMKRLPAWPIVLIDDVATTGGTLSQCALALKKAGATEVFAATLARR
ncbi:MAG TPA: ComF family protein [Abditibacteriaceae bacterium]|jgi:ComF family protein